jgi:hypothetical protein
MFFSKLVPLLLLLLSLLNVHASSHFPESEPLFDKSPPLTSPVHLLSADRADLMAKYIYAKHREWNVQSSFGLMMYFRHLQVWNNFWEYDPPKNSFDDFLHAYDSLLDSIKNEGFNLSQEGVHIGSNGILCNGAHRTTACLLYGKDLVAEKKNYACCAWNFSYFEKQGLEREYLDAMAIQYCELQPKSFILVIFPAAQGQKQKIEQIIRHYAAIVYTKEIPLTATGGFNFVLTAYENEPFVKEGVHNNHKMAALKASYCFPSNQTAPLRAYLLESDQLSLIRECKKKIRALFNKGNDTVHSSDTHAEAVILARTLFNQNTVNNLNQKQQTATPFFDKYFAAYRNWLVTNKIPEEWFCVDSGAVLAAYGLRDCQDLDFLHHGKGEIVTGEGGIDDHNPHSSFHALPIDEIIFNPHNHFYFRGIKFCALPVIKMMKERRGEPKDRADIALIETLIPSH